MNRAGASGPSGRFLPISAIDKAPAVFPLPDSPLGFGLGGGWQLIRGTLGRLTESTAGRDWYESAMSDGPQPDEQMMAAFRGIVDASAAALDGVKPYGIRHGDAHDLLVLHGLAMYARDTSRATLDLLDGGHDLSASALMRVVMEHAIVAQWVGAVPGRGVEFMRQGEVGQHRWYKVIEEAGLDLPGTARGPGPVGATAKSVPELDNPKTTFGAVDSSRQLYLQYRRLSKFVHPDVTTLAWYSEALPYGASLVPKRSGRVDPESLLYFLAVSLLLATLPYLDLLGETAAVDRLLALAAQNHVVAAM